jgi:hypothetical protein
VMERVAKVEMMFLYQWRVRVGRSGEGGLLWWCGFNASISTERGGDKMKHYRKMKRRQRVHLDSMGRKRDTVQWYGNIGRRRGGTVEGKG